MKTQQQELYNNLLTYVENNHDNQLLLEKNNQIHLNQYDYLIKRYLLNIERENDISMRQFREISETLHPMGGLQERVWNPLQIMNDFGIDVFSPSTYPPLSYSFDHLIIKHWYDSVFTRFILKIKRVFLCLSKLFAPFLYN